jgi:hypothetical protein
MLGELVQSLLTRANPAARALGYVHESVSTQARYRRVRRHWEPHLRASRSFIEQTVATTSGRTAVIVFGSGWGFDIPLDTLEHEYQQVYLLDIVHPRPVRKRFAARKKFQLIEADLTGVVASLAQENSHLSFTSAFPLLPAADLIISANVLSQLPLLPARYAERQQWTNVALLKTQILLAHAQWLASLATPVCLVSDYALNIHDRQGVCIEHDSLLAGLALKPGSEEWEWEIAPFGEMANDLRITHQVRAIRLQPGESCFVGSSIHATIFAFTCGRP